MTDEEKLAQMKKLRDYWYEVARDKTCEQEKPFVRPTS